MVGFNSNSSCYPCWIYLNKGLNLYEWTHTADFGDSCNDFVLYFSILCFLYPFRPSWHHSTAASPWESGCAYHGNVQRKGYSPVDVLCWPIHLLCFRGGAVDILVGYAILGSDTLFEWITMRSTEAAYRSGLVDCSADGRRKLRLYHPLHSLLT